MVSEDATAVTLPLVGGLTYRELHAFEHGLFAGTYEGSRRSEYSQGREKHYWRMAYLLTSLVRYAVLAFAYEGATHTLL